MFITFEGSEGCGKSTLIQLLSRELRSRGCAVVTTREPGGVAVAEKIRQLILHHDMEPITELFLYEAARSEHYKKIIEPALRRGDWVLCDRFTDSTLAYQGIARGLHLKMIRQLNGFATENQKPDLTLWLDLPVEIGLARAKDPNRFEAEGVAFQKKVRKGFLAIHQKENRRFRRIAVQKLNPEQVTKKALDLVLKVANEKAAKKKRKSKN